MDRPPTSATGGLRALALRLHFYAGVLVAPFLLVAAVTGLLYAGSWQAEKIIYAEQLRVPAAGERLPVQRQVEIAQAARPDAKVLAVRPSVEDGATTRVLMDADGLGESERLAVYVDPYRGEVKGELPVYGSSEALPVRAWLSQTHRNLHLGETGRLYSELAASWLWVVVLAGLVLWIARRRTRRRDLALPDLKAKGRKRTLSLHGTVGLWAALGLLFLSATGLTWSTHAGARVDVLQTKLNGVTPSLAGTPAGHHGPSNGGGHDHTPAPTDVDRIIASAGLDGPVEAVYPAKADQAFVVKQTDRSWPLRQDSKALDPATGEVLDTLRFADYPPLAKLTSIGISAHMGSLFGLTNQVVLAALALALIVLLCWGYLMWWRRGRHGFGRPIPRGAWRGAPGWLLALLAAGALGAAWLVPLFGYTLFAFLLLDVVIGLARRRGSATS
ncbi:PepSY domain-containing protein [Actinocorallia sp. API 0066]|uniref:PepSY-associated TM helix domain-containing protein n=1 Tax=Actinocorallia sp. API 0066 TaxID=2896846 RepID=UPI001E43C5EB|nr:PepSY-associated TM helix domain-containing protein [Actinocorallia sp. API 0066]MCD0449213.1 PepSY domain-containing protein [Actinocorallia sp. API 0066]